MLKYAKVREVPVRNTSNMTWGTHPADAAIEAAKRGAVVKVEPAPGEPACPLAATIVRRGARNGIALHAPVRENVVYLQLAKGVCR